MNKAVIYAIAIVVLSTRGPGYAGTVNYEYDDLGRLVVVNRPQAKTTYKLDAAGNREAITAESNLPPPSFAISSPNAVNEGGVITFTVTKSGTTAFSHSVDFTAVSGAAANAAIVGTNFASANGTLSFAPGDVTKTIAVSTIRDYIVKPTLQFTVELTAPSDGAVISVPAATGSIANVDIAPAVPSVPGAITPSTQWTGSGQFSISWAASSGSVSRYEIYDSGSEAGPFSLKATNTMVSTSYSGNLGLVAGSCYFYKVRACNANSECSDFTATAIVKYTKIATQQCSTSM